MKVKKYRAKSKDGRVIDGFFFTMCDVWLNPVTTPERYELNKKRHTKYYLVHERHNDWNLPNEAVLTEIDPKTLEEIEVIEV